MCQDQCGQTLFRCRAAKVGCLLREDRAVADRLTALEQLASADRPRLLNRLLRHAHFLRKTLLADNMSGSGEDMGGSDGVETCWPDRDQHSTENGVPQDHREGYRDDEESLLCLARSRYRYAAQGSSGRTHMISAHGNVPECLLSQLAIVAAH